MQNPLTTQNPLVTQNPLFGITKTIVNSAPLPTPATKPFQTFLAKLKASGRPTREIVAQVIGIAVASVALYPQSIAQLVDFYMDDARAAERELGRRCCLAVCGDGVGRVEHVETLGEEVGEHFGVCGFVFGDVQRGRGGCCEKLWAEGEAARGRLRRGILQEGGDVAL